ncbi:hypothetical protein HYH02_002423 [Chlamydomonas schloesseri]|uniref:Zinc-finger domain-containing protein n=1 Tax=Chlamydomonas schloesseri TaxID=2026947 RepID=A0A835WUS3_9CHLO|nr:hypothetical protein HYH02_002423 [Chlamydomonas schloesseri]|eukprot:KAG2453091.1 hypothetical protein HYH02_002423 [Chlamydomonas schloesseri]
MPNTEEMDLDKERQQRIAKNQAMLAELGVNNAVLAAKRAAAEEKAPKAKPAAARKPRAPAKPKVVLPPRRSGRLAGEEAPATVELDDDGKPIERVERKDEEEEEDSGDGELVEVIDNTDLRVRAGRGPVTATEEELAALLKQSRGPTSNRRGQKASKTQHKRAITCHFCRQKKLCGEEECPRCKGNDSKADCIGKSQCSRCHSFKGVFCRACLDCRYGLQLEEVRADPNWLCAHCYEQEHGPWEKHGWYCNTSFCMEDRGMKPTGQAIYEARRAGYKSVAHWLQALTLAMTPAEVAAIKTAGKWGAQTEDEEKEEEDQQQEQQEEVGKAEAGTAGGNAAASAEQVAEGGPRGTTRKAAAEAPTQTALVAVPELTSGGAEEEQEEAQQTRLEPSSSGGNGAGEEGGVEAGVELEAEVEGAAAGAGLGEPEQHAEEATAGLDVPLLKRRRVGRKAAAEEMKAQEAVKAQEAAAAAVAAAAALGDKTDEPLASRRRTGRVTRARA